MMDATVTAVLRLHAQDLTPAEIARRLNISNKKVLKILVTAGAVETEESRLYNQGLTAAEIAQQLGKTEKNVNNRIPYEKGMYNAEYPSKNAIVIRKCREKGKSK